MADRWVVVVDDTIVGGPYLWDGDADWVPPHDGELMLEAAAFEAGYRYPDSEGR